MRITDDYRAQQRELHDTGNYGVTAQKYGQFLSRIIEKQEIDHVLDYGCGSNLSLTQTLKPNREIVYQPYDPCVPKYADDPIPADLVCCIDVLEHIEPDCLEDVLDHLEDLTGAILFCSINTGPAGKTLSDGRNAHLIQQPMQWWLPKLFERFTIQTVQMAGQQEFFVIAQPQRTELAIGPKPIAASPIITNGGGSSLSSPTTQHSKPR